MCGWRLMQLIIFNENNNVMKASNGVAMANVNEM